MDINTVRNEIAKGLNIPVRFLIWANQNGTRPKGTHATMFPLSVEEDTTAEDIITTKGENDEIHINYVNSFDVQVYETEFNKAIPRLRKMINYLNTPPVIQNMAMNGYVFINSDSIIDLSALLDGSSFESRASVTLRFRVTDVTPYEQEYIERAEIQNLKGDN